MNKMITLLVLMVVLGSAQAGKVYKWVDENGQVHYSSQKPPGQDAETVKIRKGPKVQPPAEEASTETTEATDEEAVDEDVAKEAAKQKAQADAALRKKQCEAARKNLAALNRSTRVVQVDEASGKRSVMTDDQRIKAFEMANQSIKDNCK